VAIQDVSSKLQTPDNIKAGLSKDKQGDGLVEEADQLKARIDDENSEKSGRSNNQQA